MLGFTTMFRWNEETTVKFVTKYIEHECLWNVKSPNYKNKQIKQSAYLDLQNSMNIPGFGDKEIKLKIKNIRSTYTQELKKIKESKNSGTGTDTVYIPTVKWFGLLDASLRNITSILTQSESNLVSNGTHTDDTDNDQNSTAVNAFREPKSTPTKKRKLSQLSSMVAQLKEIAETTNSTADDNEFDVFGRYIGLQLKSLPLIMALEAQEYIQLYLNRIRRQYLENASQQNQITTLESPYTPDLPEHASIYYDDDNLDEHTSSDNIIIIENQDSYIE